MQVAAAYPCKPIAYAAGARAFEPTSSVRAVARLLTLLAALGAALPAPAAAREPSAMPGSLRCRLPRSAWHQDRPGGVLTAEFRARRATLVVRGC